MKKFTVIISLLGWFSVPFDGFGQGLELGTVIDQVKQYHPVIKQAGLQVESGRLQITKERGDFDPKLYGTIDHKDFDGTEYFKQSEAGIKIPTLTGIELSSSYSTNRGALLNPEMYTPGGGLVSGGIKVPLGRGMFTDEDRASLKKAKVYANAMELERRAMINDIMYAALQQYFKWAEAHNQFDVYDYSVVLARDRFAAVKRSYELGDLPAIDTLESYIQLQNRTLLRAEYELKIILETRKLSNYLWGDSLVPLEIADSIVPVDLELMILRAPVAPQQVSVFEQNIAELHPEIQKFDMKEEQLLIDRRLQVEYLKPRVDVKYNLLNEPIDGDPFTGMNPNNYKWGLDFAFPLYLRKARSSVNLADISIQDNNLEQASKTLSLQNKIIQNWRAQNILLEQIDNYRDAVRNYDRLLQAERQKFNAGESSLFLINSRENMLFTARLKLIELLAGYNSARYGIYWSAGVLGDDTWSDQLWD